jgi:hypothetical protein
MNEYEYLKEEALRQAKIGRKQIPETEKRFYNAIYKLKEMMFRACIYDYEKILDDLIEFPVTLRATLDSSDTANEMLHRAISIKRMEALIKNENT